MIERIQLLRNIGQFDSVDAGARIPLAPLTLVYAENGRGKTTLAAILRSLCSDNPVPILERRRLSAPQPPHVVLTESGGGPVIFTNGSWSRSLPDTAVFDDLFVADNVCSGVDVDAEHRQNLHELVLGARGVALNTTLQGHVARIEEHNRALRIKGEAIPAAVRGGLTVEAFCALEERAGIDQATQDAERNLAAAQAEDAVRREAVFNALSLPEFDLRAIVALLQRGLPELEVGAAARVQAHLASLGAGGEAWIADGMHRVGPVSAGEAHEICPFCAQGLHGPAMITHYRAYFSDAYEHLKQAITEELRSLRAAHSGDVVAAFERAVRIAIQRREFWARFTDVPDRPRHCGDRPIFASGARADRHGPARETGGTARATDIISGGLRRRCSLSRAARRCGRIERPPRGDQCPDCHREGEGSCGKPCEPGSGSGAAYSNQGTL